MAETTGLDDAIEVFRRLAADVETMSGPIGEAGMEAGAIYLDFIRQRFASEGDGTWAPLAESTIKQREGKGYGGEHKIMERTGSLEASFTPGNPQNVLRVTQDGIEFGSLAPQAAALHFGNSARNLPARPILVPPDAQTNQAMNDAIARGIARAAEAQQ